MTGTSSAIVRLTTLRAGRAVDVLQRGRDAFEQRDRALRGQYWLESCDLLDLGECFLEPRDRWL